MIRWIIPVCKLNRKIDTHCEVGVIPQKFVYAEHSEWLSENCKGRQKSGMKSTVENHGFYAQYFLQIKQLVEQVHQPNFGWLCDIGHFICVDEEPVEAVHEAISLTVHAHVKDFF